jgi:hypothetical protein
MEIWYCCACGGTVEIRNDTPEIISCGQCGNLLRRPWIDVDAWRAALDRGA